jgi:hypothetical protein
MTRNADLLVSYVGFCEDDRPEIERRFSYRVEARRGPTAESGVASITRLGADETWGRSALKAVHTAETGGPAAAIAAAVRYLDSCRDAEHLRKIQSTIHGLHEGPRATASHGAKRARLVRSPNELARSL